MTANEAKKLSDEEIVVETSRLRRRLLDLAHLPVAGLNRRLSREAVHGVAPGARSITT